MLPHLSRGIRPCERGAVRLCIYSTANEILKPVLVQQHSESPSQKPMSCRNESQGSIVLPHLSREKDGRVSEELCASAAAMANALGAAAIFVYTRRGFMANFLSRQRPDCPIFAFTGEL